VGQTEPAERRELTQELHAAVAARRELGADFEDPLVESFLNRVDQHIDTRVKAEVAAAEKKTVRGSAHEKVDVGVIGATFALGIPIMAIAGGIGHVVGILAAAAAILGVNFLYFIDRWIRFDMK
jgi:hypothetical protein